MSEETKKEELQEEENETEQPKVTKGGIPLRTYIVMAIAGAYVFYLGISLCRDVWNQVEGSSTGFLAAGAVFVVLGIVFVVRGLKGAYDIEKEKKQK